MVEVIHLDKHRKDSSQTNNGADDLVAGIALAPKEVIVRKGFNPNDRVYETMKKVQGNKLAGLVVMEVDKSGRVSNSYSFFNSIVRLPDVAQGLIDLGESLYKDYDDAVGRRAAEEDELEDDD